MRNNRSWQRVRRPPAYCPPRVPLPPLPVEDLVFDHLLLCSHSVGRKFQWRVFSDLTLTYDAYQRPVWTRRLSCRNLEYYSEIVCPLQSANEKRSYIKFCNRLRCGDHGQYRLQAVSIKGGVLEGKATFTGQEDERATYKGQLDLVDKTLNVYRRGSGKMGDGPVQTFSSSLLQ